MSESRQINERILQIIGSASLPEGIELQPNHDYELLVVATNENPGHDFNNHDGKYDRKFKVKMMTAEIINDKGERVKLKVRGSKSAKLHYEITSLGEDYDKIMDLAIEHSEEVVEFIKSLNK